MKYVKNKIKLKKKSRSPRYRPSLGGKPAGSLEHVSKCNECFLVGLLRNTKTNEQYNRQFTMNYKYFKSMNSIFYNELFSNKFCLSRHCKEIRFLFPRFGLICQIIGHFFQWIKNTDSIALLGIIFLIYILHLS